jgi:tetratricopeptide (TPR) repeat protein
MPLFGFGGKKKSEDAAASGAGKSVDTKTVKPGTGTGAKPVDVKAAAPAPPMSRDQKKAAEVEKKAAAIAAERDPRKARPWFERAKSMSDARNYDYAIECWLSGLKFEPDNMEAHEKLREVALRRKVNGGKPPGFMDKCPVTGKNPSDKMLMAEYAWAKDPLNPALSLQVMEAAHKAELEEVAFWVGKYALESNEQQKRPSKVVFAKVAQIYEEMQAWEKAVEAFRFVIRMSPDDMNALQRLKNLEAEHTLIKGGYTGEAGGYTRGVKDMDKQRALEQQDAIAGSASQVDENIARIRTEYAAAPENIDLMLKFVRALLQKEDEATEAEAMRVLLAGFEKFGQYRMKLQVGDVRMKQYNRKTRELRKELAANPAKQQEITDAFRKVREEQVKYELAEYIERVQNYPTDMGMRFELGYRQFLLNDNDAAIASFQEAQGDPKMRAKSFRYLGEAFTRKEWYDDEVHPYNDDKLALELRYELVKALEFKARRDKNIAVAEEAAKVASQIAQTDFNYKDIRQIIDRLRILIGEFRA